MYAQIVRGAVRDGGWKRLAELANRWNTEQTERTEGFRELYFMREVNTENRVVFIVMWESQEAAIASGRHTDVDAYFKQLMELIDEDPKLIGAETVEY
jgi:quinol monooxygenase YgiN